jgi:hypothetical protein
MPAYKPESTRLAAHDLKSLAAASPPCVTIMTPLPEPSEVQVRIKNALRRAEKQLKAMNVDQQMIESLLQPAKELEQSVEISGRWGSGLVMLRSPNVFRYSWPRNMPAETVIVGDRFPIGLLVSLFSTATSFYLLSLSQKHVHLFRCTDQSCEPITLPGDVPTNLNVWLNTRKPDHVLDNRSSAGPSTGSMKGVVFGTSSDRDAREEYLRHFFNEIDKGIRTVLKEQTVPLVLAGVEYELALYRRISSYPRLANESVFGSPDSLKDEVLERARAVVQHQIPDSLQKALDQLDGGSARVSFDGAQIVRAAQDGRVAYLFLREGNFAREGGVREGNNSGEEAAANTAAIETLLHGGEVFMLSPDRMPDGGSLAALMRY